MHNFNNAKMLKVSYILQPNNAYLALITAFVLNLGYTVGYKFCKSNTLRVLVIEE